ncbi:MAG: hypothetical protein V4642_04375 [Bacteroidota bacterium]
MQKQIRILNYAVNGLGLGHITRLIAINRWIRRLCGALGAEAEITFLTSSECDTLAYQNGFPAFKIPSKNIIRESGMSPQRYRQIAKQWIWNAVNLCSPDILVVDTFPSGSFDELFGIFDFPFKKVFIHRAVRPEIAAREKFQSALSAYHSIVVSQEKFAEAPIIPEKLEERIFTTGEIMLRNREEIFTREEAREQLGIEQNALVCYITAGGGGDAQNEMLLGELSALADSFKNIHFVIGAGPLYRGREFRKANCTWLTRYNAMELFNAFDFAVSAGGYNSVYELLYCGIPTIFYPQTRLYDDQNARIEFLKSENLCLVAEPNDVFKNIEILLNESVREGFKNRALKAISKNHALDVAQHILSQHFSLDELERAGEMLRGEDFRLLKEWGIAESDFLKMLFELDYKRRFFEKKARSEEFFVKYHGEIPFKNGVLHDIAEPEEIADLAMEFLQMLLKNGIDVRRGIRFFRNFASENVGEIESEKEMVLKAFEALLKENSLVS